MTVTDRIRLENMEFYGYHGALPEENRLGQRFTADVELSVNLYKAGASDSLDQTINYAEIYERVRKIIEGPPCTLIETVAGRIAEQILTAFSQITSCHVRVSKPDPPIPGNTGLVSVEIERRRVIAYLGLGSNIESRENYLEHALNMLDDLRLTRVVRCSSIFDTDPVGPVSQADFLNLVAGVETLLPAEVLLEEMQNIEKKLNRRREIHWGPRTIDLDLLVYGDQQVNTEQLSLPHPEISRRAFVLAPFTEIAPHVVIPGISRSVLELWQMLKEKEGVRVWKKNNGEGKFGLFGS
jgi:dihydroneopterin aldolase/2-amino-4-hydroxy-6-hydroxymethyldihydropteridine pyrophosphokinase